MAIPFSLSLDSDGIHNHQLIAQALLEALPHIAFLKGKTLVLKLT